MSLRDGLRRLGAALREFDAEVTELTERQRLCNRPWEEEFLHWSDGELHGWRLPPPGRRIGTTRKGWCPAQGRQRAISPSA